MDLCQFAQICRNSDVRFLLDRVLPDPLVSAAGLFSLDVRNPPSPVFESVIEDLEPLIRILRRERRLSPRKSLQLSGEEKHYGCSAEDGTAHSG
jgi:hypothetical protein